MELKKMNKFYPLLLALVILVGGVVAGVLYLKPSDKEETAETFGYQVLKIDGEYVDSSLFEEEKEKVFNEWSKVSDMMRKTEEERNALILDSVIKRVLLEDYLYNKSGVSVAQTEVEDHIDRYVRAKFSSEEEMNEMMEQSSVKNEEGLKKSIEKFLLTLKALPKVAKQYGITVEEEEINKEYRNFKRFNTKITLKHILISTEKHSNEEASELAQNIYSQLKDGANFDQLAKEYSDDEGTKAQGGLVKDYPVAKQEEEFAYALVEAEDGKLLPPYKTENGYEIALLVKLQKFYPEKDAFAENLYISKFTASDKYNEWLDKLKSQAGVEITHPGLRAYVSFNSGKYSEAARDYERAYNKYDEVEYLEKAAESYKLAGEWNEVKRVCDMGIKKYSLDVTFYVFTAEGLHRENKTSEAIDLLKQAESLASQTKNVIHLELLEKAYLNLGLNEDAKRVKEMTTTLE